MIPYKMLMTCSRCCDMCSTHFPLHDWSTKSFWLLVTYSSYSSCILPQKIVDLPSAKWKCVGRRKPTSMTDYCVNINVLLFQFSTILQEYPTVVGSQSISQWTPCTLQLRVSFPGRPNCNTEKTSVCMCVR